MLLRKRIKFWATKFSNVNIFDNACVDTMVHKPQYINTF